MIFSNNEARATLHSALQVGGSCGGGGGNGIKMDVVFPLTEIGSSKQETGNYERNQIE
jgi:hypothetical protein